MRFSQLLNNPSPPPLHLLLIKSVTSFSRDAHPFGSHSWTSSACWSQSVIPTQWKMAAIKPISKSSAVDEPSSPSNFRPIARTSCIGKLFTTILRNHWLDYMTGNGFLNCSIQKAFMSATPGCVEHHCKLAAILAETRKKHKSLAVCWLDLANAYGSVHHSLIQFSVKHYHAPPKFSQILQSLYSGLGGISHHKELGNSHYPS